MTNSTVICNVQQTTMSLTKAILIYESGHRDKSFATVHEVVERAGTRHIGAGTPVTQSGVVSLMTSLSANQAFGFLPDNVLAIGSDYLVWWAKPQKRTMWFKSTAPLDGKCGLLPTPALLFAVIGTEWAVYALPGTERPTAETQLYQAPFFNVWETGRICTGNVTIPTLSSVDRIAVYENAFFESNFTHPNVRGKGKLTRFRGGPYALWSSLMKRSKRCFPIHTLVPINRTAGDLVHKVTAERRF